MGKSKEIAGRNKSKRVASSSSGTKPSRARKQRKVTSRDEPSPQPPPQQQTNEAEEQAPPVKQVWGSGSLSAFEKHWQGELFDEKMEDQVSRKTGFICEREITDKDFRPFGVCQRFEELGWEAALKCYDGEKHKVYIDSIQEWVGSLEVDWGNRPPKTISLKGHCNGQPVVMSYETLGQIAKFDSKPSNQYNYPNQELLYRNPSKNPQWSKMIQELFLPGKGSRLIRNDLKLPARLMLLFVVLNVMPRKGDKSNIRKWEIPILYSLMTGRSKISYRYLVMMNIWEARENREKKIIPHCRLITALLKKFGAVDEFSASTKKDIDPLTLTNLRKFGWLNTETERYLKLKHKDTGKKLKVLKHDARMLAPGEEDEPDSGDSEVGASEGESEDEEEVGASSGIQQSSYITSRDIGAEMEKVIQQGRTPDWGDFPDFAQVLYDQNTHQGELRRLESQRIQEMLTSLIERNSRTTTDTL